jgi:hypothetical protein
MANRASRAVQLRRPFPVGLLLLCATAGLIGVVVAGCGSGSGDGRAKVEDSLRDYLGALNPEQSSFPLGAGVPRVKHNACTNQHVTVQKGKLLAAAAVWRRTFPEDVALWSCVVTFGRLIQQTTVAVTGKTKVVWAVALPIDAFPLARIAHTDAGITCNWPREAPDRVAVCQLATERGLGVAVGSRIVVVVRPGMTLKRLFVRNQPDHSPGFGPVRDKRIFHSETHRGIVCNWSRTGGGTALCNRVDRHGYVAGVSKSAAIVLNEHGKIVFRRNHS